MVLAGDYTNTFSKRQSVANTQVMSITDGNGLVRQFVFPDNEMVEIGDTAGVGTVAQLATFRADRWSVAEIQ